jgi:hypothetical protein
MLECYSPHSVVDMSWFRGSGPEFVRRSQYMSQSRQGWGGHRGHRLSPPAIRVNEHRALAELPLGIERASVIDGLINEYGRAA